MLKSIYFKKMPKKNITKKKVLITLDLEIVKRLKRSNKPISTHINEVLSKHFLSKKTDDFDSCISDFRSTANAVPLELRVQIPSLASLGGKSAPIQISNQQQITQNLENSTPKNQNFIELKIIYFKTKNEYKVYTLKKFTRAYSVSVFNCLSKLFEEIGVNEYERVFDMIRY
ncbi:hypothetical protein EOM09_07250 [bacterium]|nr:hypothetical protein [bacterium]